MIRYYSSFYSDGFPWPLNWSQIDDAASFLDIWEPFRWTCLVPNPLSNVNVNVTTASLCSSHLIPSEIHSQRKSEIQINIHTWWSFSIKQTTWLNMKSLHRSVIFFFTPLSLVALKKSVKKVKFHPHETLEGFQRWHTSLHSEQIYDITI